MVCGGRAACNLGLSDNEGGVRPKRTASPNGPFVPAVSTGRAARRSLRLIQADNTFNHSIGPENVLVQIILGAVMDHINETMKE